MTRDEVKGLIMVIQAAYPNYHPADKTVTINLWQRQLEGYEYKAVLAALEMYIATDITGFAPVVGQVIDQYVELTSDYPSEDEAWAMYRKAIGRASCSKEEFDKLPEIVQKAVGNAQNIYTAGMSQNFNEDVAKSNFLRSYRTVCERDKKDRKMPRSAKMLTSSKLLDRTS